MLNETIDPRVHQVKKTDQLFGRGVAGTSGIARHVGKKDRCFGIGVGDFRINAVFESLGNSRRQDVNQQVFRSLVLTLGRRFRARDLPKGIGQDRESKGAAADQHENYIAEGLSVQRHQPSARRNE